MTEITEFESTKPKRGRGLGFSDPEVLRKAQETRARKKAMKLREELGQKEAERAVLIGGQHIPPKAAELPKSIENTEEAGPSVTDMREQNPYANEPQDFFYVDGKNPEFEYYHAGGTTSQKTYRRVQALKRIGYEVVTASESEEKAFEQEDRSGDMEKTTGIPGHILMRTPREKKQKRIQERRDRDQKMAEGLRAQQQFDEINALLKQSGIGGDLRQELEHIPQEHRIGEGLKDAIKDLASRKGRGKKYFT